MSLSLIYAKAISFKETSLCDGRISYLGIVVKMLNKVLDQMFILLAEEGTEISQVFILINKLKA